VRYQNWNFTITKKAMAGGGKTICGGSGKIEFEDMGENLDILGDRTVETPKKRAPRARWPEKKQ
jgi:hypothetical protein